MPELFPLFLPHVRCVDSKALSVKSIPRSRLLRKTLEGTIVPPKSPKLSLGPCKHWLFSEPLGHYLLFQSTCLQTHCLPFLDLHWLRMLDDSKTLRHFSVHMKLPCQAIDLRRKHLALLV